MEKLYLDNNTFITKDDLFGSKYHFKNVSTPEELNAKLSSWTDKDTDELEIKTKGQSLNEFWKQARYGRITASKCSKIVKAYKKPKTEKLKKLANELVFGTSPPNFFAQRAMKWGTDNESTAMKLFKELNPELSIEDENGLYVSKQHMFLGASPDGLATGDNTEKFLIEIKCPYTVKDSSSIDQALENGRLKYILKVDDDQYIFNMKNDQAQNYYHQIQMSLYILNLKVCKFIIYTPQRMKVLTIHKDENWEKDNVDTLVNFWKDHIATQIVTDL